MTRARHVPELFSGREIAPQPSTGGLLHTECRSGGINDEATCPGIFANRIAEPRMDGIGRGNDGRDVGGKDNRESAPNHPRPRSTGLSIKRMPRVQRTTMKLLHCTASTSDKTDEYAERRRLGSG